MFYIAMISENDTLGTIVAFAEKEQTAKAILQSCKESMPDKKFKVLTEIVLDSPVN